MTETARTGIYTLSLHDALPISRSRPRAPPPGPRRAVVRAAPRAAPGPALPEELRARLRSEEHTPELQSQSNLVWRLLLEKKKDSPGYALPPPTHGRRRPPPRQP